MSIFRLLHLRRFFEHRFRTFLSLAGISIGAALVVAVLGFFGSMAGSVDGFIQDLAGLADLEVAGVSNEGFDQSLFFKIEETQGVRAAVPIIRSPVKIAGKPALLLGFDQRAQLLRTRISQTESARLQQNLGATSPAGPGVLIGEPLARMLGARTGSPINIYSAGGLVPVKVAGVIGGDAARLNEGIFVATALPLAQQIVGKVGRLDSVLVISKKGTDLGDLARRLSAAVGNAASVDSPAQRAEQARIATRQLRSSMLMGVSMAIVVGGFLIFITMNMAATERRRELATLRALGGRRGPLLGMFLLEAATVGLLGSAFGALLGLAVSRRLVESIPPFFAEAVGVQLGFHLPAYAIPAALGAGVAASIVAAFLPARRAIGVSPVESMRPEGVLETAEGGERISPVPTVAGVILMAGGLLFAVSGPPSTGFFGLGGVLAGILLASYGLTGPMTRITAAVASRLGVAGRLGAAALERSPRRGWATSAAVLLATGLVAGQGGIFNNLERSIDRNLGSLARVGMYVSTPESATGGFSTEVQLPGDWEDDLSAIDGVKEVGTNGFVFVNYRKQKVLLQFLGGSISTDVAPAFAGASHEVRAKVESGEGASVSTRFRDLYGVDKGDVLELPTPIGLRRLKVLHVAPSFAWERGLITIGRKPMIEWFGHTAVSDYLLGLDKGADPAKVRAEIDRFVAKAPVQATVITGAETLRAVFQTVNQINALFRAMTFVIVCAAALAILNALLISVVERKRELGIMRAIGTGRRQLRRMVGLEAASIGIVGGAVGAALGFLVHRTALAAINAQTGFPIGYELVTRPAATAFALGVTIAVIGSILPAQRAGAVNIIEAIGYE